MKNAHTFWLVLLVLTAALSVAGGVFYAPQIRSSVGDVADKVTGQFQALQITQDTEGTQSSEQMASSDGEQSLGQTYEDMLNGFLTDLSGEMKAYKQQRKVVDDLLKPVNLRESAYVDQNYILFQEASTELRDRMQRVVTIFSEANKQMKTVPEDQLLQKWNRVKNTQLERYLVYLAFDDEVLKESERLLTFYLQHKEGLYYDFEADELYPKTKDLYNAQEQILDRIDSLKKQRSEALSKNG